MSNPARTGNLIPWNGRKWAESLDPLATAVPWLEAVVQPGTGGAGIEQGLDAAYASLEILGGGPNAGFERADADLAILHVTDEVDASSRRPGVSRRG